MKWYKFNIKNLTDEDFKYWYSLMDKDKQKRVDKFRFTEDKKRTVAGEMLIRKGVSEWCKVAPESIIISTKEKGKPYTPHLNIHFNISHCEDMVVCAIDESPVGIDIEKVRPIDLKAAKIMFNTDELFYLFSHTPTEDEFKFTESSEVLTRFFKLWTKKEACGKCTGQGIFNPPPTNNFKTEYYEIEGSYLVSICTE